MDKRIIDLCNVIGKDLAKLHKGDTASALWPFLPNEAEFYVGESFITDLYKTLKESKKRGFSEDKIANLFGNPSKLAQYFTLFHSAKKLKIHEREELALTLINLIQVFRKDIFCSDGKNILNKPEFKTEYLSDNPKLFTLSKKISALGLLYLEILYPTMMRMGQEFHGFYLVDNKKIFIKEFFNLKPISLGIKNKIPFNKIKIVEELSGNTELDFFNHLFKSADKRSVYIECDGKILDEKEANRLYNILEKEVNAVVTRTADFNRKDWFKVYARGIFYSMSLIKKELGLPTNVPEEVFNKIEKEEFALPLQKILEFQKKHSREEIEKITTDSYLKIFES